MKLALVDIETTGGRPAYDRITEIAVIQVDNGKKVGEWQTLINPERSISPLITNITGITNQMVETAPLFADVYSKILEMTSERIFVAHNVRFDYAFIKHELLRLNHAFSPKQLCTVKLSRKLVPNLGSYSLESLIKRFGIEVNERHRAMADTQAMYDLLSIYNHTLSQETVEKFIKTIIRTPSLPANLNEQAIQKLPNTVGVYIFYDKQGAPLYVGKSLHIKDRVLSHFYEDVHSTKELNIKQQVTHIETRVCAGELEALLLESKLVKELMPIYNRMLRSVRGLWVLSADTNQAGYRSLKLTNLDEFSYQSLQEIYAVSKTKRSLLSLLNKICKEQQLCPKLSGLETGKGACFWSHLGDCRGACKGQELPGLYNARVDLAFKNSRIVSWPFDGPVIVSEENEQSNLSAFHLVYNWVVVKTSRILEEVKGIMPDQTVNNFCLDDYKILYNFITTKHPTLIRPTELES